MKRFFAIAAALLLTVLLAAACGPKNQGTVYCPATEEGIVFSATVEERKENSLLVLADEDASVRSSSDRFSVALSGAQLLDQEGNALEAADFWLLDRVEIAFEGQVAETYPAQITAKKVTRLPKEPLTLARVQELAEKGEELTWTDFAPYEGREIGSGLYIMRYQLEEDYSLVAGGVPGEKPMYIRLCRGDLDQDDYIDIREASIQDFLAAKETSAPEAAGDYPAALRVEGKVYLLGQPMPAEVEASAIIGRTVSYTDGWPQQDGETNFSRELDLPYARVEGGIALLYENEWHFCEPVKEG